MLTSLRIRSSRPCVGLLLLTVLLWGTTSGCQSKKASDTPLGTSGSAPATDAAAPTADAPATGGSDSAQGSPGLADKIRAALEELPPEERALVAAQKVCPVSDQPLGSMGKPIKVHVADRDVFICCEGCEESLKADPEKYLAKLSQ